jgi:hypothetical protein
LGNFFLNKLGLFFKKENGLFVEMVGYLKNVFFSEKEIYYDNGDFMELSINRNLADYLSKEEINTHFFRLLRLLT